MQTTYHLSSAQDISTDILDAIKATYKSKPITIIVEEDNDDLELTSEMKMILEKGINVISTAEEMAYPKAQEPVLADELNKIAKDNGVTVLGTGINPGFIMDLLVIALCLIIDFILYNCPKWVDK